MTSSCISTPVASLTLAFTSAISASTSAAFPCCPAELSRKLAWRSETTALPTTRPLRPDLSISAPAEGLPGAPHRVAEHAPGRRR